MLFHLSVGNLGTTTATGSTSPAANLPGEVASRVLASCATTATARSIASASAEVTTVGVGLGSSWLNDDVLAVDGEVLIGQSSLVALNSLVLNKRAVLESMSQ